jgi:hypothetical protein
VALMSLFDDLEISTDALGKTTAKQALGELIARPGYAPKDWQSAAPDTSYESTKIPVGDSDDLQRIKALPRREPVKLGSREAELLVKLVTKRYARQRSSCDCAAILDRFELPPRPCIKELNLTQAWALYEIERFDGLLGPIGVGHGKTILDLLAALAFHGCKKAVLLVPPGLVLQLIAEYEFVGEHFRMPTLVVWGNVKLPGDVAPRQYYADKGNDVPTLHVFPYSRLSRPESTVKLQEIAPDLIICDEAHKLRHADTATTARVLRYFDLVEKMREKGATVFGGEQFGITGVRCAAWSGSLTDSSLKDYAHLAYMTLRDGSPLPRDPDNVEDWSRALDPKVAKDKDGNNSDANNPWSSAAPPGELFQLDDGRGGHISEVYHRRLVETPGVVATQTPAVAAELRIEEQRPTRAIPDSVAAALDHLRGFWQRPDGEELIDALTVARCARELACGFYYRWKFPPINGVPQDIGLILEWLDIRKDFRKEMRWKLGKRVEHIDSPHLCELAAKRFHGDLKIPPRPEDVSATEWDYRHPQWDSVHWPAWRDIKGRVQPETEEVWLDDYLALDASEWAQTNTGIVWYESNAFGERVAKLSGLTKHGGGPDAGKDLMRYLKETGGRKSIICSIKSHGTGRDGLQRYFYDQLIGQPPSSATTWEQLLGRLHRIGQPEPCVYARFYRHTPELADHVDKALARALYVQTTLGSAQKLRSGFQIPAHSQVAELTMQELSMRLGLDEITGTSGFSDGDEQSCPTCGEVVCTKGCDNEE